jgi:hypothetical protein
MYRAFCRDNDLAGAQTANSFGRRMMDLVLLHKVEHKRTKAGVCYSRT